MTAGLAVASYTEGWPGRIGAVLTGLGTWAGIRKLEPAGARRERLRIEADAAFAADLLAGVLRAGAPPAAAAQAVGATLGGPLGERLTSVSVGLRMGRPPAEAWAAVAGTRSGSRLAAAAIRSSESGSGLAVSLDRLAGEIRAERLASVTGRAHRAAVLVVLPLGLCFLPAFMLGGFVPVLITILHQVLP